MTVDQGDSALIARDSMTVLSRQALVAAGLVLGATLVAVAVTTLVRRWWLR